MGSMLWSLVKEDGQEFFLSKEILSFTHHSHYGCLIIEIITWRSSESTVLHPGCTVQFSEMLLNTRPHLQRYWSWLFQDTSWAFSIYKLLSDSNEHSQFQITVWNKYKREEVFCIYGLEHANSHFEQMLKLWGRRNGKKS
jgi:hypothetical protein